MDNIDITKLSDKELMDLEHQLSDEVAQYNSLQMAQKILLNSLYGALGNSAFRYFDLNLSSAITTSGQLAIKWIERKLNEWIDKETQIKKDRVVLIDTDSVVLDLEDLVNQCCDKNLSQESKLDFLDKLGEKVIHPYIAKSYSELADYTNAYDKRLKMKRENIINTMIAIAAKHYVMEVYNNEGVQYTLQDPYMKIMGLVLVKSSTPEVIRQDLRRALPIMLHGQESDIQQFVRDVQSQYDKLSVEEIAFPRGVTNITNYQRRTLESKLQNETNPTEREKLIHQLSNNHPLYIKGSPVHVKASLIYNDLIDKFNLNSVRKKIIDGDKIKYVYLKLPNPINEECVAFQDTLPKEFGLTEYVDYRKMFEKTFTKSLQDMIDPLQWSCYKKNNLTSLFEF